jgi:hypothetical protein
MFSTYEKTFTNSATSPVRILVTAIVEDATNKITDIVPCGGSLPKHKPLTDAFSAESERMHTWVRATFIGQGIACFNTHNGVVPSPWSVQIKDGAELLREAEDLAGRAFRAGFGRLPRFWFMSGEADALKPDNSDRRYTVVNTINIGEMLNGKKSDFHRQLADAIRKQVEPRKTTAAPPQGKAEPPRVGTYWRRNAFTEAYALVIGIEDRADGRRYIEMKHVERGMEDLKPFKILWLENRWPVNWTRVYGSDIPGRPELALASIVFTEKGTIYATFGGNDPISVDQLSDSQILAIEREHKRDFPDVRNFLESHRAMERERNPRKISKPSVLGAPYGEDKTEEQAVQLEAGAGYYQQFLNSVDSSGVNELPPREGERYFSIVSGNVYRVIDTTRKPYSREYYVTMERASDKHRTKFTFRNHAVWLAVWRPVDDNGEAREVVQVEVESKRRDCGKTVEDCKARFDNVQGFNGVPFTPVTLNLRVNAQAASEVMQKIGEAAHEAAAQLAEYMREVDEDGVLDDLVRIYDELHRRVPGWNNKSLHEPGRTEADLAIRAIRKLARDLGTSRKNFEAELSQQKKQKEAENRQFLIDAIRKIARATGMASARSTLFRLFPNVLSLHDLSEEQMKTLHGALLASL